MNNYEQELLGLYRENSSLRDQVSEADVSNIEKITAIKEAIDELHQIVARARPSNMVAYDIDQVIADLEKAIR